MTRGKYQRRGQQPVPPSLENQGVEPVSTDALNATAPIVPPAAPAAAAFELYPDVPPAKMVSILLSRHYRPMANYEIVGHWKPSVEVKNAAGQMVEITPARFVDGEPMPPPIAGVGSESLKLWAGTVVRLPSDEAKRARRLEIGSVEIDD
jgi:hypothetical protein